MDFLTPEFFPALLQIIGIDIVLAGDNAVVIALAARKLPAAQQRLAIIWGCAAAVLIRITLTSFAAMLLTTPWLRLIGSVLLFWIGIKLLTSDIDDDPGHIGEAESLGGAIKTIIVADVVMSFDNVIGVAGAAGESILLLVIGLAISIPLVVFASTLVMQLMRRFPFIIVTGAALIGWVAGDMAWREQVLTPYTSGFAQWVGYAMAALGAMAVITVGYWINKRQERPVAAGN